MRTIAFILIIFLAGCKTTQPIQESPLLLNLSWSPYNSNLQKVNYINHKKPITLIFPTFGGSIFGNPSQEFTTLEVDKNNFTLTIPVYLSSRAEKMRLSDDLKIKPNGTKSLRIATFHHYPEYGSNIGGGYFANKANGNPLLLMYFSNPVSITGTVLHDNEKYIHDIQTSEQGWFWLEVVEVASKQFEVKKYAGDTTNIEFAAILAQ